MSQTDQVSIEQVDAATAFKIAMMARRKTFLAFYPRKLKIAVALILLGLIAYIPMISIDVMRSGDATTAKHNESAISEEELASIPTSLEGNAPMERHEPKTEEELAAASTNDTLDAPMSPAPDMGLIEEVKGGILPKVGADGRRPWQVYAKTFDFRDPRPRVVLVIGDLGLSRVATDAVIHRMPPGVTLAFDAQSDVVGEWLARARHDGHETLLSVPMEPFDFPNSDPGPNTLLTSLPNSDNVQRLHEFLKLGTGYAGLTTLSGSRFITDPTKVEPILEEARKRGLLFLDPRISNHSVMAEVAQKMRVPVAEVSRVIDLNPTPQAIDAALAQLEQSARVDGVAVALASPLPVTLDRLELWINGLSERGVVLSPLSTVVR